MLEGLTAIRSRARRPAVGAALRRLSALCAVLGLLAATLAFAPTARADDPASAQGEPSLAAAATSPFFLGLTVQGDTAQLRIGMRNTGQATWEPGQGIQLRRLGQDGTAPEGESYPLEQAIRPGQTANWDIVISPPGAGLADLRYAMCQGEHAFGSEARAMIIVLPNLQGTRQVFGSGIDGVVQSLTEWGGRTFGDALGGLAGSIRRFFGGFIGRPDIGLPGS